MTAFGLKAMFRWTLGANRDARPGLPSALSIMGVLVELQLSTANTCRGGRLVFRTGSGSLTFGLPILPVLAVPVGAFWATGLPGYRRLPIISAEARLYELEAVFGGACATSFLSFFCGEAYALSRVNYICRLASISFAGSPPWPGPVAGQRWSGSWGRQTRG